MINGFLWQGKKAKCAFHKLIKSRNAGGVGHVQLKDYYLAAILAQLKYWFPGNHAFKVADIGTIPIAQSQLT